MKDSLHIRVFLVSDPVTRGMRNRHETERRDARGQPVGSLECPVRVGDPCLYGSRPEFTKSGDDSRPRLTGRCTEVETFSGRDETFTSILTPREEFGEISGRSDQAVYTPDHEDIPRLGRVVGEPLSQLSPDNWSVIGRRAAEIFGRAYMHPTSTA